MKYYELTYLITPELSEKEAQDFHQKIISFLQEKEAILDIKEESVKRTKLAYPIRKKEEAFLATVEFYLDSKKISEVRKEVEKKKEILRYLIVTKKKYSQAEKGHRTHKENSNVSK